jgi:hypothetical protein
MTAEVAEESDLLRAALAYARRGWPVAPAHSVRPNGQCSCNTRDCEPKNAGKHPRTAHGLTDATTDEKTIREWWTKWPDANVFIRTGKVGSRHLVVLDVDPRHNGDDALAFLLLEHGDLPPTPVVKTGGGGTHLFFWSREPIKNSAGVVGPGLDVRGEGGYVIAAPSNHVSGGLYEWDETAHPTQVPIAEIPAWLTAKAGVYRAKKVAEPGDLGAKIIGERNVALTQIAGAMRRPGIGEKAILAALRIVNEDRCHPPLDDWEVEKIARSVARYPAGAPVVSTETSSEAFPLLNWTDLRTELPPTPWVCQAIGLAPGAVTLVGGAGFGGKTTSLQALLLAVASGQKLWGALDVKRGRAIHVDLEQGRPLTQSKYQRIGREMGLYESELDPMVGVCCLPRGKLDEDSLVRLCDGASVAFIDAFRGAFPEAKENDSAVRVHLDMMHHVSERTGCAIIVIAHSRKLRDDDDDVRGALRGSSAIFDAAQTVIMLDGAKGKPTRVTMVKERITGKLADAFGIQFTDVEDSRGNSGLRVSYVSPPDLQAAYMNTESDVAASLERISSMCARLVVLLPGPDSNGITWAQWSGFVSAPTKLLNAARDVMLSSGEVERLGTGSSAVYRLTGVRPREPGED